MTDETMEMFRKAFPKRWREGSTAVNGSAFYMFKKLHQIEVKISEPEFETFRFELFVEKQTIMSKDVKTDDELKDLIYMLR